MLSEDEEEDITWKLRCLPHVFLASFRENVCVTTDALYQCARVAAQVVNN